MTIVEEWNDEMKIGSMEGVWGVELNEFILRNEFHVVLIRYNTK